MAGFLHQFQMNRNTSIALVIAIENDTILPANPASPRPPPEAAAAAAIMYKPHHSATFPAVSETGLCSCLLLVVQGCPPSPEHRSYLQGRALQSPLVYCEPGAPVSESGVTISSSVVPLRPPHLPWSPSVPCRPCQVVVGLPPALSNF